MTAWICTTCCVEFAPSDHPPEFCPICSDERQFVGPNGQQWTDMAAIGRTHRNDWRALEHGLSGIGVTPSIGIGQRALLVQTPHGNVLWDCVPLVEAETVARIRQLGGVQAMVMSHPHFYAAMVSWSDALGGVPIYLPESDHAHVMRPAPQIRFWGGDTETVFPGVTLIRCGGHFEGSSVLHWADGMNGQGVLLTGDTIQVAQDTRWAGFMRSYPNLIPLPASKVRHIAETVRPLRFERLYGGWWDRVMNVDAHAGVQRSAERYIAAIE